MNSVDIYNKILKCECDGFFICNEDNLFCENCMKQLHYSNSYINFFSDESKRPFWSIHMQTEFINHGIVLNMTHKYEAFEKYYSNNPVAIDFFDKIANSGKIIIDLASGPSGYFGTLLKKIDANQFFIISDGSPMILEAHMEANKEKENVGFIDLDLDNLLPFQNNSIDCFMGNFLGNVMEYRQLISEVHRSLRNGGRYSVIELFFEKNSEAAIELKASDKLYAELDEYIQYCNSIGFQLEAKDTIESIVGKLDPSDSLPRNDTDKSDIIALHFIKN